eukprot:SM000099S25202  [mRNA]  locus=s99:103190:106609:+ [translate_table: standard]
MCSSATSRCELDRRANGTSCNAASGGYTSQCANLTCQAGICTVRSVRPRINHTCTDPPGGDQWNNLCFDARCSSDGRCLFKTFPNSSKDCFVSNEGLLCSSFFCNGNGVCNVRNNYTDGAPCSLGSADYQSANTSCTGRGSCDYSKYYTAASGTMCGSTPGMGCANMACSAGQCQVSSVYANGIICDTHNPNALDDRCQVSSCSNGQCSNVVSNKPAGTVCLPTPTGYESEGYFYIDGTCESDECCAHCDGTGVMKTSEMGRAATHARLALDAEKGLVAASPMAVSVTGLVAPSIMERDRERHRF